MTVIQFPKHDTHWNFPCKKCRVTMAEVFEPLCRWCADDATTDERIPTVPVSAP